MTLVGGTYRAEVDLAIALAGAPMAATIRANRRPGPPAPDPPVGHDPRGRGIGSGRDADRGPRLPRRPGRLADAPRSWGAGPSEDPIRAGDLIPAHPGTIPARRPVLLPDPATGPIRVVDGPDAGPITGGSGLLEAHSYRVTDQADRMGLRLDGPGLDVEGAGRSSLGARRAGCGPGGGGGSRSSWGSPGGRWVAISTSPT